MRVVGAVSYRDLVELSRKAADITASACASCASNNEHCCRGCAGAHGYLGSAARGDKFDAITLKYGWDEVRGFATNTGCRLPREIRSPTCLAYYCGEITIDDVLYDRFGREKKGIDEPLLPREMAAQLRKLIWNAEKEHPAVIARALKGRISV